MEKIVVYIYRCKYCGKEFSSNDASLDNAEEQCSNHEKKCAEMHSFHKLSKGDLVIFAPGFCNENLGTYHCTEPLVVVEIDDHQNNEQVKYRCVGVDDAFFKNDCRINNKSILDSDLRVYTGADVVFVYELDEMRRKINGLLDIKERAAGKYDFFTYEFTIENGFVTVSFGANIRRKSMVL